MTAPKSHTETVNDEDTPTPNVMEPPVRGALLRYRVLAYVVGFGLLALVASMVLDYGFDQPQYTTIVGPVHGFLYMVYLVFSVDLAIKARWSVKGTILVLLAGVIPFVSFYAEHKVTSRVREGRTL